MEELAQAVKSEFERAEQVGVYPLEIFGSMTCPECEHANEVDAAYCGGCGVLMPA